eukprot:1801884-Amphidinium_carterae.1
MAQQFFSVMTILSPRSPPTPPNLKWGVTIVKPFQGSSFQSLSALAVCLFSFPIKRLVWTAGSLQGERERGVAVPGQRQQWEYLAVGAPCLNAVLTNCEAGFTTI